MTFTGRPVSLYTSVYVRILCAVCAQQLHVRITVTRQHLKPQPTLPTEFPAPHTGMAGLSAYAEEVGMISDSQEGFCKGRNCARQLQQLVSVMEDAQLTRRILFLHQVDFAAAFNSIDHPRLLLVLERLACLRMLSRWSATCARVSQHKYSRPPVRQMQFLYNAPRFRVTRSHLSYLSCSSNPCSAGSQASLRCRAVVHEMNGDLPEADAKPPENMVFVCNLNQARMHLLPPDVDVFGLAMVPELYMAGDGQAGD